MHDWRIFWKSFLTHKELFFEFVHVINEKMFENAIFSNLFLLAKDYAEEHKDIPSLDTLRLLLSHLPKHERDNIKAYIDCLDDLKSFSHNVPPETVRSETYRQCEKHEATQFLIKSANNIENVTIEKLFGEVQGIMKKFQPPTFGLDVTDVSKSVGLIQYVPTDKISTGSDAMNKYMYGGWGTNELAIFMAPPGVGKSASLINVMFDCMLSGADVLYVSCELSEKAVLRRFYSRIALATKHDLLDLQKVEQSANRFFSVAGSKGRVIYYPSRTLTVDKLDALLEQLQTRHDFSPKVLLVDYLDLLAPKSFDRIGDERHKLRGITTDLRSISLRRDIAVISATQANRASLNVANLSMANVSESFGKVEVADIIIAICQTEDEFKMGRSRFVFLKNRDNVKGGSIEMYVDFERMVVMDLESAQRLRLLDAVPSVEKSGLGQFI